MFIGSLDELNNVIRHSDGNDAADVTDSGMDI